MEVDSIRKLVLLAMDQDMFHRAEALLNPDLEGSKSEVGKAILASKCQEEEQGLVRA